MSFAKLIKAEIQLGGNLPMFQNPFRLLLPVSSNYFDVFSQMKLWLLIEKKEEKKKPETNLRSEHNRRVGIGKQFCAFWNKFIFSHIEKWSERNHFLA